MIHDSKILSYAILAILFNPVSVFSKKTVQKKQETPKGSVEKNVFENKDKWINSISDAFQMAYVNNIDIQLQFNELKYLQEECFKVRSEWFPNINVGATARVNPSKSLQINNTGTIGNVQESYYCSVNKTRGASLNFTIAQNLYNGGQTTARSEAALEGYRASWCEFKNRVQGAFINVVEAFVDMSAAKEIYLVSKMREKSLGVVREVSRSRAIVGDQRMVDVSLANAQCIRMTIEVNNARQEYLEKKMNLENLTGFAVSEDTEFPVPMTVDLYSVQSFIDLCLKNNPVCQKLKHLERQARCKVSESGGSFLPIVDVSFQGTVADDYNFQNNNGFTKDVINTITNTGYSAIIEAKMPIFDGGGRTAAYRQSELLFKKTRLDSESQKRDLISKIKLTMSAYKLALQNVVSSREALKEQGAAFSAARDEYSVGATSMVDLLGMEEQYVSTIQRLIATLSQLVKISYQLKVLQGQLTPETVHVKGVNYDIIAYRKAFSINILSLGDNQSKTSLYNNKKPVGQKCLKKNECVDKVGSVLLKKIKSDEGLSNAKSALKEAITWYPAEGIVIQENSDAVAMMDTDIKVSDVELEDVMNKSLDELAVDLGVKDEPLKDVTNKGNVKDASVNKMSSEKKKVGPEGKPGDNKNTKKNANKNANGGSSSKKT